MIGVQNIVNRVGLELYAIGQVIHGLLPKKGRSISPIIMPVLHSK